MTYPARPTAELQTAKSGVYASSRIDKGFKTVKDCDPQKFTSAARQTAPLQQKQSAKKPLANKPSTISRRQPAPARPTMTFTGGRETPSSSTGTPASCSSQGSRQSSSAEIGGSVDKPARNSSKSSVALRSAISRAKQEAASKKTVMSRTLQEVAPLPEMRHLRGLENYSPDLEASGGSLRGRIKTALLSGQLNVAAMEMESIPAELRRINDMSEDVNLGWSECVDLSKFIAADNKLAELDDDCFPDATNAELEEAEEGDQYGQFRGLEVLDLHNNLLKEIPLGLRRLQNLHHLNLSGNKLANHTLSIICQIGDSLTDLRMSENEISEMLPDHIKSLRNLQILELHGNKISELPEGVQELVHLRTLNLARNKLTSIPSEILNISTLTELTVASNRLSGVFVPPQCQISAQSLKSLDLSYNTLEAIATGEITLPVVQTVNLSGNRIKSFPDISSWEELLTLTVSENLLSELPAGFVMLRRLRNSDLSNNNIIKVDKTIARMEQLVSLNLAGNPLRERKYLTMSTAALKADLAKRSLQADLPVETESQSLVSVSSTRGVLDWSAKSATSFELHIQDLDDTIYDLRLHHNSLNDIPVSLLSHRSFSDNLRSIDMSHNPLRVSYLSSSLTLAQLKDLSLAFCHLKSLDALTTHLSAPKLDTLNISSNNLSGFLPRLRSHFPTLATVLAADNHFSVLEIHAAQGLVTLDIRNNEIDHLEPRLGLLGGSGGLRFLEVSGNKFRVPRWDILAKGTEAILKHLRDRVPLNELSGEASSVGEATGLE
jgi:Leucine-rich repeat (LRR) protein